MHASTNYYTLPTTQNCITDLFHCVWDQLLHLVLEFAWFQHLLYVLLHMQQFAFCCVHLMHYQQTFTYSVNVLVQDWLYKKMQHTTQYHATSNKHSNHVHNKMGNKTWPICAAAWLHHPWQAAPQLWWSLAAWNMQHTTSTISESYIAHNIV